MIFRESGQLTKKANNILKIRPTQLYYIPEAGVDLLPIIEGLGNEIPVASYLNFLVQQWSNFGLAVTINDYVVDEYSLKVLGSVSQGIGSYEGSFIVDNIPLGRSLNV